MLIALTPAQEGRYLLHLAFIVYGVDYQVSNPVRSPRFRASASVTVQKAAFATGVPPNIYAFHRYTRNSAFLSCTQEDQFPSPHGVEPRTFKIDLISRLRSLYAQ